MLTGIASVSTKVALQQMEATRIAETTHANLFAEEATAAADQVLAPAPVPVQDHPSTKKSRTFHGDLQEYLQSLNGVKPVTTTPAAPKVKEIKSPEPVNPTSIKLSFLNPFAKKVVPVVSKPVIDVATPKAPAAPASVSIPKPIPAVVSKPVAAMVVKAAPVTVMPTPVKGEVKTTPIQNTDAITATLAEISKKLEALSLAQSHTTTAVPTDLMAALDQKFASIGVVPARRNIISRSFMTVFGHKAIAFTTMAAIVFFTLFPTPFVHGFFDKAYGTVKKALTGASTVMGFRPGTHENEILLLDKEGNISIMGHIETDGQFRSYAKDGIAPIVVDSKTEVKNLNAEMVGGNKAQDFTLAYVTKNGNMTTEDVYFNGAMEVGKTLLVKGATKLLNNLSVDGNIAVLGDAKFSKSLTVSGPAYFETLVNAAHIKSAGLAALGEVTTTGNVQVGKNIYVRGAVESGSAVIGRQGMFGTGGYSGDFSAGGKVALGNAKETLTINSKNITLDKAGNMSLAGALNVAGDITVGGIISGANVNFTGSTTLESIIAQYASTSNATSTNFFASVAHIVNGTIDTLTATFATIGTLVANDITVGALTATNTSAVNSTSTNATSTNIYAGNAVFDNLTANNLTFLSQTSVNSTSTNATSTNQYAYNLSADAAAIINAAITNLTAASGTIANLASTNAQFVNSTSTNATTTNFFATNSTVTNGSVENLIFNNATGTNATTTSLYSVVLKTIFGSIDTFNSMLADISNLTVINSTTTNATTTNLFAVNSTTTNAVITNLTTTNANVGFGTTTNATSTNLFADNANLTSGTVGNLGFTNATGTNATTTNISTTGFTATNGVVANLTANNANVGFGTTTHATSTTIYSTSAVFGGATTTSLNTGTITATDGTITNLSFVNATGTAATTTSFFTSVFRATTGAIDTFTSSFASFFGFTATNSTTTNATSTNLFATTSVAFNSTVTNLTTTNANVGFGTTTNATSTNLFATNGTLTNGTITNLSFVNATGTAATTTSFFSTVGRFTTGVINTFTATLANITSLIANDITVGALTATNSTTTNATSTTSFATTSVALSGTVGNLGFTNATGTNATTTNFFATTASSTNLFSANGVIGSFTANNLTANSFAVTGTSTLAGGLSVAGSHGLTVLQNGNVGFGTTSPFTKVSVAGDAYIGGNITATGTLSVTGAARVGSSFTMVGFGACSGSQALQTDASGNISCAAITIGGASNGGGWLTNNTGKVTLSTTTDLVTVGASSTPYAKFTVLSGSSATTTLALFSTSGQVANIIDAYDSTGALSTVLTSSGSLGLGTANPNTRLDLAGGTISMGPLNGAGEIRFRTGTANSASGGVGFTAADHNGGNADGLNIYGMDGLSFFTSQLERFTIAAGGNVGIGTTTPLTKLEVYSSAANGIRVTSSASSPWITLKTTTPNTTSGGLRWTQVDDTFSVGILSHNGVADNNLEFYTGGAQKMTINSTGNVGIGISAPTKKLQIHDTADNQALLLTGASTGALSTDGLILSVVGTLDSQLYNQENGYLRFGTNNAEVMRLTNAGNVGIGSTSPAATLGVQGNGLFSGNLTAANITATGTLTVSGDILPSIDSVYSVGSALQRFTQVFTRTLSSGANSINIISGINSIFTNNGTERMRIDGVTGNIGIGTTNPTSVLSVLGTGTVANPLVTLTATDRFPLDIVSNDSGVNPHYLRYYRNSASPAADDYIGSLAFEGNDAAAARRLYAYFGTKIADTTANSIDGTFFINTTVNNVETEIVTIKGGNVGIGTTNPASKLSVRADDTSTTFAANFTQVGLNIQNG